MSNILKDHLKHITEEAAFDMEDEVDVGAPLDTSGPGRVAYKPDPKALEMRARKNEMAALERELGRKLTQDEIDLVFSPDDGDDAPIRVDGTYGRDDGEDDGLETRRAERGPTSRKF